MSVIPFLSYVFVTTFTPGPNNIMSMINGAKHGAKGAVKFSTGICLGFSVVMAFCFLFGSFLVNSLPAIKPYLTYIGAAYILYLAYKIFKSDYKTKEEDYKSSYGLKEGFFLQFVNPKGIIYGLTVATSFILPSYSSVPVLLAFALGLGFVAFVSTILWALFGSAFQKVLQKHTKIVNAVMALLLVYTAVSLFL